MDSNLRTLGPNESKLVLSLTERGQEIVQASEVIALLGSEPTARKVIHNLLRKGWLTRLVGGRYMLLPPSHGPENLGENNILALASAAVMPSYVGWWAAASFHGFTTQRPRGVALAVLKQRSPVKIEGNSVRFVQMAERKFFGFMQTEVYGRQVSISTPAKTVVDCVDRPSLAGGASEVTRIMFGASRSVAIEAVVKDALQMQSQSLLQRLGFLADLIGWRLTESIRSELQNAIGRSIRSKLGRKERRTGDIGYVHDWGILVNASEKDLLADVPRIEQRPY